jgi:SAM-dependent methyltransferase
VTPALERDAAFAATQSAHFTTADAAHFAWQTGGPGFAPLEAALLSPLARTFAAPYLEIGCGEGGNFVHVGGHGLRLGVDAFPRKLAFARERVPGVDFAAGDAAALPLASGTMRLVLIRDVLHHLRAPERALSEAVRVLAPGGRMIVIEPNGANPLVALQARLVAAEQRLRQWRPASVAALLRAHTALAFACEMTQALPLRRAVLHSTLGLPSLGRSRAVVRLLDLAEAACARALPRRRWAIMVFSARKAGAAEA